MRLGCNSVVFAGHPPDRAVQFVAWAGFAGIEFAALPGMADHFSAERPDEAEALVRQARDLGLETPAVEADGGNRERLYATFALAGRLGVRVVSTGSGGESTPESLERFIPTARQIAGEALAAGVTWVCKPHVRAAVYSSASALRLVEAVASPGLRLNFDPTHIQRVGEAPATAAAALAPHLAHVHIRDYASPGMEIGPPEHQTAGSGMVDLPAVLSALAGHGYDGWLDLEIIGAAGWDPVRQMAIAAGSRGYLARLLREMGDRRA